MTRHYVTPDADGTPVLWGELGGPDPQMIACRVGRDRIHVAETQVDRIWSLLTAVLAPDEATVERLARAVRDNWPETSVPTGVCESDRIIVRTVLAGIGDTDTEAGGGNG